jgi:hypothetical protein
MAGVAMLAPGAWTIRKLRAERVAGVPGEATLVKLTYRPVIRWAAKQAILGRCLDRTAPGKGRFTRAQVARVLQKTWQGYGALAPGAHLERLETLGSRHNVLLGVLTLAAYRALLAEGIEERYATELLTDLVWKVYAKWVVPLRLVARRVTDDPQQQMNLMLRMLLRYPFSRPGYDWQARLEPGAFALDIYRCPVYDYLKSQGADQFMLRSWCTLDFALAQVMTTGGHYQRPHTLAAGDKLCDMKWFATPKPERANGQSGGTESPGASDHPVRRSPERGSRSASPDGPELG